jgi:hypothetical protein
MKEYEVYQQIRDYLNSLEHNFQGKPIFRITWANDEFEMREGNYNEFTRSGLFIRTVHGIKRTPKYPQLKNIYIIEQLFDGERVQTEQIKDHNGYECIYAFRDKNFNPLPIRLDVVQLIMKAVHKYRKSPMLTKSILQDQLDEVEKNSEKKDFDQINEDSFLITQLHDREAISLAGLGDKIKDASK